MMEVLHEASLPSDPMKYSRIHLTNFLLSLRQHRLVSVTVKQRALTETISTAPEQLFKVGMVLEQRLLLRKFQKEKTQPNL